MRPARSRSSYWALAIFVALMALPSGWFTPAFIALAGGAVLVRAARAMVRARAGGAPAPVPGGVRLGVGRTGQAAHLSPDQLSAHGLIVGASGSGKSTTLLRLLTARIADGLPVVAVDMKGSPTLARTLAEAAARAGRPFLLWTPDGPARWNPLAHGNPTELKDKLISTERFSESHYQKAGERYLQLALGVFAAVYPDRRATLADAVSLCDPPRLAALLRRAPENLRVEVQDYLARLTGDQLSGVRGLAMRLALLTESHAGRQLVPAPGVDEIDLPTALHGQAVVLFSLNSASYGKLAAQLGTMVVQDLVAAAGERLQAPDLESLPPALVAVDEFSALDADQILALFARGREARMSVIVATQEFADLRHAAPGLLQQVTGNTVVKIVHRQDVPESARMVSEMCGTVLVPEDTRHYGPGTLLPRGTRRLVERPRVHPNEIMALEVGETVVITKVPQMDVRSMRVDPVAVARTNPRPRTATPTRAAPVRPTRAAPARPTRASSPRRDGRELS